MLLLTAAVAVRADEPAALFQQAGQDYDAGRFAEAFTNYERIASAGWVDPALFFNAGNAAFRRNDLGHAILNYRRAWSLAPRDAEIAANLRFALERAGVSTMPLRPWEVAFSKLTGAEWRALALAGYWLAAAAWGLCRWRGRPAPLRRVATGCALVGLLGLAGVGFWWDWRSRPEWVVVQQNQQALFAPLDGATAHFALPPGSIVRLREESGDWLRVTSGKDTGWIRRDACRRVIPWQAPGGRP